MASRIARNRSWMTWWWAGYRARIAALAAGLKVAGPSEVEAIAAELIDELDRRPRRREPLDALAGAWDRLTPAAREAALAVGGAHWPEAVDGMLASPLPGVRRGGASLVGTLGLTSKAPALVELLAESGEAGDAAEQTLRDLMGDGSAGGAALSAALREIVLTADRHQRSSLLLLPAKVVRARGVLAAGAVSVPLREWLKDAEHPAHLVMRSVMRRARDSRLSALAWRWLASKGLGSACAARLAEATTPDAHAAVLEAWHLWAHPARERALLRLKRSDSALPAAMPAPGSQATIDARIGHAKWAARTPHHPRARDAMLAALLADPSPAVRHAAVREASRLPVPPACLADFCFDTDAQVACSAAHALLATTAHSALATADRLALAQRLLRSPHAAVRSLAHAAMRKPSRRRGHADLLDFAQNDRVIAARLVELRRGGLSRAMLADLAEFVRGAGDERPRVVATAVAALGGVGGEDHDGVLIGAARSADARVRANALEAITRRVRRAEGVARQTMIETLRSALEDPSPRAAAAAARGLLLAQPASAAPDRVATRRLGAMLAHPDEATRAAALWVCDRLADRLARCHDLLDSVATITKAPASPREEARAHRAGERLVWHVRDGWRARAARMGAGADQAAGLRPAAGEAAA